MSAGGGCLDRSHQWLQRTQELELWLNLGAATLRSPARPDSPGWGGVFKCGLRARNDRKRNVSRIVSDHEVRATQTRQIDCRKRAADRAARQNDEAIPDRRNEIVDQSHIQRAAQTRAVRHR